MDVTGAISVITFFGTLVVIFGGMILTRHRERMSIIEKGLAAEDVKALYQQGSWRTNPLASLKWGILLMALGAAFLIGTLLKETYRSPNEVTIGLVVLFGGIALLVFYAIAKNKVPSR